MLDAFSVHEDLEAFRMFSNNLPGVDSKDLTPEINHAVGATSKGLMFFLNSRAATSG